MLTMSNPSQSSTAPAVAGAASPFTIRHPIARLQPALARSDSTQSNRTLVSSLNRSMSDLANNPVDNAALEYGLNGGIPGGTRPTVMTHFRQGRYHQALEALIASRGLYIKFVTFAVMFGMTVAGLWLAIAQLHQTIV